MLFVLAVLLQQPAPADLQKRAHTYSIVAWDSATGDLVAAVQSRCPSVGGCGAWARAGVGAGATQSLGNAAYGERGLELMALGASAPEVLRIVMRSDPRRAQRQVGMVDARGNTASWTGDSCFDWAGGRTRTPAGDIIAAGKGQILVGRYFAAQANIMVSDQTVKNMADAFQHAAGALADRLMAALQAGQAGGGGQTAQEGAGPPPGAARGRHPGGQDPHIHPRNYHGNQTIRRLPRPYRPPQRYLFP